MDDFLENILPALRFDFLIESTRSKASLKEEVPIFILKTPKYGITATARLIDSHFVVKEGSLAQNSWIGKTSLDTGYCKLHQNLIDQDILQLQGKLRLFTKSYAFKSPSAAATIINGRPTNGTTTWKMKDTGQTYKEWEAQEISKSPTHNS